MATAYVDLNTIHNPATGTVAPAAWGDQVRENFEALIDPPAASVFNSAAVSVPDATVTVLNADSEKFDNDALHSTVSNTSRITIQKPGRYEFSCRVNFQADITDGRRVLRITKNGSIITTVASQRSVIDGSTITISGYMKETMIAGDYMEVFCFHNGGNALTVTLEEFTAKFDTR